MVGMRIPGTNIEVDDFRSGDADLYVLTHYHADHRRGLRRGDQRPILCSPFTAKLLKGLHGVGSHSIRSLDVGETLAWSEDLTIRAFDANHCPGALMLLFTVGTRRLLHTGDFRYHEEHDREDELFEDIDTLLLDATYQDRAEAKKYPSQEEAIDRIVGIIEGEPDRRVLLGVYTVGKNKIVESIHRRLGLRVFMPPAYHKAYCLLGMEDCVTARRSETRVHGLPMGSLRHALRNGVRGDLQDTLCIFPTGWTDNLPSGPLIHVIPYSEHCSGQELEAFISKVKPREIVVTNDFF